MTNILTGGTPLRPVHVHVSLHHLDPASLHTPPPPKPYHHPPCSLPSDQMPEGHWRPFNSFITAANHVASSGGKLSWIYAELGLFCLFSLSLKGDQLIGTSMRTCQQSNKQTNKLLALFCCCFSTFTSRSRVEINTSRV